MGKDPQADKRAQRASLTVFDLVESYLSRAVAGRRSVDEIARRLRKNVSGKGADGKRLEGASSGAIGDMRLSDLHRRDLTKCIDSIVDRGAGTEANRVFEDLRAMVRWARGRGDVDQNLTEGMKRPTETTARDRWLTEDEIRTVWAALPGADMSEGARRILRLCLITGQRVGEVSGMTRDELSEDFAIWTIPAARSKNKQTHTVPLPAMVIQIIRDQIGDVEALAKRTERDVPGEVFPSPGFRGPVAAMSLPTAVKRQQQEDGTILGVAAWTPHDLRRTAATHMETLGQSPFVVGHVLNHLGTTKASITSSVYARYDYSREKAEALSAWAAHLDAIIANKGAKILRLERA